MELPAIVKILTVFAGVLLVSRLRLPLGLGLIFGGVALDLWAGHTIMATATDLGHSLLQPELWLLLLNITLIVELGYFMAREENGKTIIRAARNWGGRHGQSFSLVLIPAAIGLVPMPGGALFSAPLVGQTVESSQLSAAWLAAVNYWFRHILEYWWPLYPVVIVTLSIFDLAPHVFILVQLPFTFVSIAAGWFFLLRPQLAHLGLAVRDTAEGQGSLWSVLTPIILVVIATLLLPGAVRQLLPTVSSTVAKLLAMLGGLVAALAFIGHAVRQGASGYRLFRHLFTRKTWAMLLTLIGVMVFQAMLEGSGLLPAAGREMTASHIPATAIIALLPFVAGLVTGIAIGFAGTAFPLVAGLAAAGSAPMPLVAALVLAFTMGYAGMMLSPVHLCFVLTRDFFSASLAGTYRYILPCVATVIAFGLFLHLLLRII
jgi:hypothetical protein